MTRGHVDDALAQEVVAPLKDILRKYYLVQEKNFFDLDEHNVYKHQVLHMSKLVNKMVRYLSSPTNHDAKDVVINEVAPDLLIYAQEISLKSNVSCWRWEGNTNTEHGALPTLLGAANPAELEDVLRLVSGANAVLADYCDRKDHKQTALHNLSDDAAKPMTDASAAIYKHFSIDPIASFKDRLDSMVAKYEGWTLPG